MSDPFMVELPWAISIVAAAFAIALPAWPARRLSPALRTFFLIVQGALLFALPWVHSFDAIHLKIIVVLGCCASLPPKLFDTHLHPEHWRDRPMREWLVYLLVPLILIPRLHVNAPKGWEAARQPAVRGLLEISLGAILLWLAFLYDKQNVSVTTGSFWVEHATKLLAAYLIAFDGGFLMATALVRTIGLRALDFSHDPIVSITPADFWRRYNCEAGRFLRQNVFYPLRGRRHPYTITFLTFVINGVLHEYLALVLVGRLTGYQFTFFALHGLAAAATMRLHPHLWPPWARRLGNIITIAFLYFSSILFFATIDLFVPWYQSSAKPVQ